MLSIREALHIIVETNSRLAFNAIESSTSANSPFQLLVEDCISICKHRGPCCGTSGEFNGRVRKYIQEGHKYFKGSW